MAIITVSDAVYAWPSRVLTFICLLYAAVSLVHHSIKVKSHISSARPTTPRRNAQTRVAGAHHSLYLSLLLIVFVLIYNIFSLFIQYGLILQMLHLAELFVLVHIMHI